MDNTRTHKIRGFTTQLMVQTFCPATTIRWGLLRLALIIHVLHQPAPGILNEQYCLANALVCWTDISKKGLKFPQQSSSVYLTLRMQPNLPGFPPLYLHTAIDQRMEVVKAWEWSYRDYKTDSKVDFLAEIWSAFTAFTSVLVWCMNVFPSVDSWALAFTVTLLRLTESFVWYHLWQ